MRHKKTLSAGLALLGLTALDAQASLTLTDNGLGVYDSALNATWTQDANLLGALEANAISQNGNDNSLINNIINASGGVIYDTPNPYDTVPNSGVYTLSAADFGNGGTVDWWAGQAFAQYLNTINYGGSSQWALPTTVDSSSSYNYPPPASGSQLAELWYNELGGTGGDPFSSTFTSGPFKNVQSAIYWSGTEDASYYPSYAYLFSITSGFQTSSFKYNQFYAWAVASPVPVPGAAWWFGTGLLWLNWGQTAFKRNNFIKHLKRKHLKRGLSPI